MGSEVALWEYSSFVTIASQISSFHSVSLEWYQLYVPNKYQNAGNQNLT